MSDIVEHGGPSPLWLCPGKGNAVTQKGNVMSKSLIQLLNTTYPLIQAPMAGVSTPALAAAVSEAGALGSLGLASASLDQAASMIREVQSLTRKPVNVNFFCHQPTVADPVANQAWLDHLRPMFDEFGATPPSELRDIYRPFPGYAQMLELVLETRPAVVSFHFGLPSQEYIDALKNAGIVLMATATTPAEARQIETAGIDVLVAQGYEAGGHRGVFDPENGDAQFGTFALVHMLAKQSSLPVVAAGGIMDGDAIKAALALGASGVQCGTAFVLCPESAANDAYRQALQSERAYDTRVTITLSGRAARGLRNRLYIDEPSAARPATPGYSMAYDAAKALNAVASARGNYDFAAQWAGQAAALARPMSAAQMVQTLADEAGW